MGKPLNYDETYDLAKDALRKGGSRDELLVLAKNEDHKLSGRRFSPDAVLDVLDGDDSFRNRKQK